MKKRKITFALLLISGVFSSLFAQSSNVATVHFYQGRVFGIFSAKYRIYADGKLLCKLGRNSHCQVSLPTGTTTFTAKPPILSLRTQPALVLNLENGKEYYVQGDAKFELFPPNDPLFLTQIVPDPAKLQQIRSAKTEEPLLTSTR